MTESMKGFPALKPHQIALVRVEARTGIVLTTEGARHTGQGETYEVFDSLESARGAAARIVKDQPSVECNFYDASQTWVGSMRNEHEGKPRARAWWKFWQ